MVEPSSLFASDPSHLSSVCIGSSIPQHDCADLDTLVENQQVSKKDEKRTQALAQIYSVGKSPCQHFSHCSCVSFRNFPSSEYVNTIITSHIFQKCAILSSPPHKTLPAIPVFAFEFAPIKLSLRPKIQP